MHAAMGQLQGVDSGQGCLASIQCMAHARDQQPVFNRIQTLWTFGVARPHFMEPTIAVGKVASSSHNASLYFKKSTTYQGVETMNMQENLCQRAISLPRGLRAKPPRYTACKFHQLLWPQ
jgi:hypothetical protein